MRAPLLICGILAAGAALAQQAPLPDLGSPGKANKSYRFRPPKSSASTSCSTASTAHLRRHDYAVSLASIRRNLRDGWVVDNDPFKVNQFAAIRTRARCTTASRARPASTTGSRSATRSPAARCGRSPARRRRLRRNDQIASGIGGSFLGEPLFRMANLVLEKGDGMPPFWREIGRGGDLAADRIQPARVRRALPRRSVRSHEPDVLQPPAGRRQRHHAERSAGTSTTRRSATRLLVDFSLDYGLPGKPGYTYTRPFDYFSFQATASSANGFENLMTRGLLRRHATTRRASDYRGIWGLYGSYDYIAPQIFRVSSTALSLGTTGAVVARDDDRAAGHRARGRRAMRRSARCTARADTRLPLRRRAAGAARAALHLRRPRVARHDRRASTS